MILQIHDHQGCTLIDKVEKAKIIEEKASVKVADLHEWIGANAKLGVDVYLSQPVDRFNKDHTIKLTEIILFLPTRDLTVFTHNMISAYFLNDQGKTVQAV